MLTIILNYYSQEVVHTDLTPLHYGLFDALSRVIWSIALCYIIFACVHHPTGSINRFLSHWFWQPVSRLSYSMFCVHFAIILVIIGTNEAPSHFSALNYSYITAVVMASMCFFSVLATLAFEVPFNNLRDVIFNRKTKIANEISGKMKNT